MLSTDNPRGGIDLRFDTTADAPLQSSPIWRVAGRALRFVWLPGGSVWELGDGAHYTKVILGRLSNVDLSCLAQPFEVRSTRVTVPEVTATSEGALLALMTATSDSPPVIEHPDQLAFSGEASEALSWQRFDEKFAGRTDYFDGMDCYMANGWHLLNSAGEELAYVNPWACGKGVDLSTHNHGHPPSAMAPAFTEVHWVLSAAAPDSGMYTTAEPGAAERQRYPMALGDEHGPFYDRDADGRPLFRDNGAVQYPWHGWQGGDDGEEVRAYDFVAAFEINPKYIEARP